MQILVVTLNSYSASLTQFSHFELDFQRDFFCTYLDHSPSRRSRCSTSFPPHLALVWLWYAVFRLSGTGLTLVLFLPNFVNALMRYQILFGPFISNFSPEIIYDLTRFPRIYLGVSAIHYYRDFSPNYLLYSGGGCLIWFFDREIYTNHRITAVYSPFSTRYWYICLWLDYLVLQMHR